MGIDTPKSGETITKGSVTTMHESVRTKVNGMESTEWGRATFGLAQVSAANCSIVHHAESKDVTTEITFSKVGTAVTSANVASVPWQELTAYKLDNSGNGYALGGNYDNVMWFNCRVREYTDSSNASKVPNEKVVVGFVLGVELSSGSITILEKTFRVVHFFKNHTVDATNGKGGQEIPVSIWAYQQTGPVTDTLHSIRVYVCKLQCGAASSYTATDKVVIAHGTTGLLSLRG